MADIVDQRDVRSSYINPQDILASYGSPEEIEKYANTAGAFSEQNIQARKEAREFGIETPVRGLTDSGSMVETYEKDGVSHIYVKGKPADNKSWLDTPSGNQGTPQTPLMPQQGEKKEATIDDIRGMANWKYKVNLDENPYDVADKKFNSDAAAMFLQKYRMPITDIDRLDKEKQKEWKESINGMLEKYRSKEKLKHDEANDYFKTALAFWERDMTRKRQEERDIKKDQDTANKLKADEIKQKVSTAKQYMNETWVKENIALKKELATTKDKKRKEWIADRLSYNNTQIKTMLNHINRLNSGENIGIDYDGANSEDTKAVISEAAGTVMSPKEKTLREDLAKHGRTDIDEYIKRAKEQGKL